MGDDGRIIRLETEMVRVHSDIQELRVCVDGVKTELHAFREDVAREFGSVRAEMAKEVASLRVDMEKGLGSVRSDMEKGLGSLRSDMEKGFGSLRTEMAAQCEALNTSIAVHPLDDHSRPEHDGDVDRDVRHSGSHAEVVLIGGLSRSPSGGPVRAVLSYAG